MNPKKYAEDYDQTNTKPAVSSQYETCGQVGRALTPEEIIEHLFTYHSPTINTLPKFQAIREAGKYFAKVIAQNVPFGQDRLTAILKVREAVMVANAGVSLDGVQL